MSGCMPGSVNENAVSVIQGATKTFELSVVDEADAVVDITGARILFTVKSHPTDPSPLLQKTTDDITQVEITNATQGKARVYLYPSDTRTMAPKKYVYDVWVILSNGKRYPVIPRSTFEVLQAVTVVP